MTDTLDGGDLDPVAEDTAPESTIEDRGYDNFEAALAALSDDEDTADDEQPAEAPEQDAEAADEEDSEGEAEGDLSDAVVELPNGETVTVAELESWRANGMRQADYTRKTTELATEKKVLEQERQTYSSRSQFVESVLHNLTGYLEGLVPPEPPLSLAQANPSQFQYQKALREGALAEISKVLAMRREVESAKGAATAEDQERYLAGEREKLAKAMPQLADPGAFDTFRNRALKSAVEAYGFTDAEISVVHDNRLLRLAEDARLHRLAKQNRENAKRRVETPKQARPNPAKAAPDPNQQRNREAMRRLAQSGSIEDALAVDF